MHSDMPPKLTAYLAGRMSGLVHADAMDWRRVAEAQLADIDINVRSPMRWHEGQDRYSRLTHDGRSDAEAAVLIENTRRAGIDYNDPAWPFKQDRTDILLSDMVFAMLRDPTNDHDHVSIGTVVEIAWAYELEIPIYAVTSEHSVYNHMFIANMLTATAPSISELVKRIEEDTLR